MKARLPQGFGGGPANMNSMIKQAQKMQELVEAKQAELEAREFRVTSGGGMVEVAVNGKKELLELHIKPEIVDPEDVEALEDTTRAAVNEAIRQVEETANAEISKITGNLNVPGFF